MGKETALQRKRRLEKVRNKRQEKLAAEDDETKRIRLDKRRSVLKNETELQRETRLSTISKCRSQVRLTETLEQRKVRNEKKRNNMTQLRSSENPAQRITQNRRAQERMSQLRASEISKDRHDRNESYRKHMTQIRHGDSTEARIEIFLEAINTHCDKICEICTKRCYPNQVINHRVNLLNATYLPQELACKTTLLLCHRCHNHLNSNRSTPPSKSYFNNLEPGLIPDVIKRLSQPEQRLLLRIIPFTKIVKLEGRFGQYGFRGQAVLFALDIFEVTEKLPNMLPRSTDNIGMVVVSELLENINLTREFSVSRNRVYEALQWLITNNPLYKDVVIDHNAQIQPQDLYRYTEPQFHSETFTMNEIPEPVCIDAFVAISNASRILRASWHQGNRKIFELYPGIQCFAMVLANIVRATQLNPNRWTNNILNTNMLEGDAIYAKIRYLSNNNAAYAPPIEETGYLEIRHFGVIRERFNMFDKWFYLDYDEDTSFYGNLQDSENQNGIGMTLKDALFAMFYNHKAGALITGTYTYGVLNNDDKFYFTNSHSCGPKGTSALENNGKACVIQCDSLEELVRICKRTTGTHNMQYTLNYINVHTYDTDQQNSNDHEQRPTSVHHIVDRIVENNNVNGFNATTPQLDSDTHNIEESNGQIVCNDIENIPIQTSLMAPIDSTQPREEEELDIADNINQITRKTKDNLVNEAHECKAEEFAWFAIDGNR